MPMPDEQHSDVSSDENNVKLKMMINTMMRQDLVVKIMMTKLLILMKPRDLNYRLNTSKDTDIFWHSKALPIGRALLHNAVTEDVE